MNKQIPSYLRLVTDTSMQPPAVDRQDLAVIQRVNEAFARATGWQLEFAAGPIPSAQENLMWSAPVNPGVGTSPGHIRLLLPDGARPADLVPLEPAGALAECYANLWGELLALRHALWQREAELATGVPLVSRDDDDRAPALCERLEAVLRGGAEAIGCQAAALYLLDAGTSELKLRSAWGLSRKRLAAPARSLRTALADLEALLGHAVVLNEPEQFDYWKVPESGFAACVCVPVSSPAMPLGTLWTFSERGRDFSASDTNILEVVAGRLAADLERQVLVDDARTTRDQSRQIVLAQQTQQEQMPAAPPSLDGWEMAARVEHARELGGAFYDWFALDDRRFSVVAGQALPEGLAGAMVASTLRGAARAFDSQRASAGQLLSRANGILWTGSAGGSGAGVFHAIISQQTQSLTYAVAGPLRVVEIGVGEYTALSGPTPALGLEEAIQPAEHRRAMCPGELVLVYGTNALSETDAAFLSALDERLALALEPHLRSSAEQLIEIATEILAQSASRSADRLTLLLKRRAR